VFPRASERALNPQHRRHQDIRLPRFDLLNGARIEVHKLSQLFLSELPAGSLSADIRAESLQLGGLNSV
jgi:hypothetical protein